MSGESGFLHWFESSFASSAERNVSVCIVEACLIGQPKTHIYKKCKLRQTPSLQYLNGNELDNQNCNVYPC